MPVKCPPQLPFFALQPVMRPVVIDRMHFKHLPAKNGEQLAFFHVLGACWTRQPLVRNVRAAELWIQLPIDSCQSVLRHTITSKD